MSRAVPIVLAICCLLLTVGYLHTAAAELRRGARVFALLFVFVAVFFGSVAFALMQLGGFVRWL